MCFCFPAGRGAGSMAVADMDDGAAEGGWGDDTDIVLDEGERSMELGTHWRRGSVAGIIGTRLFSNAFSVISIRAHFTNDLCIVIEI